MRVSIQFSSVLCLILLFRYSLTEQFEFDVLAENGEVDVAQFNSDLEHQYSKLSNDSLLWGPYRSALYFGIRPRLPNSLISGLMWYSADGYDGVGRMRHFYEQGDNCLLYTSRCV